ncbi:class I SAM-dependent DNA methyltransferase [Aureimonas glaciei]|uniref:Methyltransferase n=1 Tax=Aureimonas glaciei TaxID=1776957 RepID=A0A916XSV5_9HYPH|nr:class I SAM-dependent methyltransferase [Aureimonas glaciei]GGD04445.1 methyltransferase [Aureimonas glaciei]
MRRDGEPAPGEPAQGEASASLGYDAIADRFDAARGPKPWEWRLFEELAAVLPAGAAVLDCGCGSGHLGLAPLLARGCRIQGVDGSAAMLALFSRRYATVPVRCCDMRQFEPAEPFDAIIAWDSLFHLTQADQARMLKRFGKWLLPGGRLIFTSGPSCGSVTGDMFGTPFRYWSLDEAGYRDLLAEHEFVNVSCCFDEPAGDNHRVWTAAKR